MATRLPTNDYGMSRFERLPFSKRLSYACQVYLRQTVTGLITFLLQLPGIRDPQVQPHIIKSYKEHRSLRHRIFVPKTYPPGDPPLPLYLDIHGGGFAFFAPVIDDSFCTDLCNTKHILVVSLDYPKAPRHKHPALLHSLIDTVTAILNDETLPYDRTRGAVIGGFSAGANLALAICQTPRFRDVIKGVVAFYPPVNWEISLDDNLATRPANAGPDPLAKLYYAFQWSYISVGHPLRDPTLSVGFASRESLPPKVFIIGCELDLLRNDAEILAESLAKSEGGERIGTSTCWQQGGIRWENVLGVKHGFNFAISLRLHRKEPTPRAKELHASVFDWLSREVYGPTPASLTVPTSNSDEEQVRRRQ